jgi:FAD/FMN-containing dehydrogenase
MLSRRQLLAEGLGAALGAGAAGHCLRADDNAGVLLNDVQSQLNGTRVRRVLRPTSIENIGDALSSARREDRCVSMAGGRHSMGGQQFGKDNLQLDMTGFKRVLGLDIERGLVTAEAGIQWPELIQELHQRQLDTPRPWTIREKQTGVDAVTLGGSLSSNVHGRALAAPPIVGDVESFQLLDAAGKLHTCSRKDNAELFAAAVGGYGLFGVITHVTLRLIRRFKVQRRVEIIAVRDLLDWRQRRVDQGFVFGDCQYSVDLSGDAESHPGVFPCYEPVEFATPVTDKPIAFAREDWARLYQLIRTDKRLAFELYAQHYRKTDGQVYWSDTHQLAGEFVGHRDAVDTAKGTEMITEVYLKHDRLMDFFSKIRRDLKECEADITYGTIRFIEADQDTMLPWARERACCVVCNLHVRHTEAGIAKAKADFRMIIDRVIEFDGSFYLTYHRWATPGQVLACYPKIGEFLRLKRKYDPQERLQSEWYRHYAPLFG